MRVTILALCCLLLLSSSAAASPPILGIGEQESQGLDSPLFRSLGINRQRLTIPWDATDGSWPLSDADLWLSESRRMGLTPLVFFGHSRIASRKRYLPSASEYLKRFRAFRSRFPWVYEFGTWNEVNYKGQPTFRRPGRVAAFYKAMRRECPACTIVVASFLDTSNMLAYLKKVKRRIGPGPHIWGLHNYTDLSLYRDKSTRKFIRAARGKVWIVETGGLAVYRARKQGNLSKRPASERSQRKVIGYLSGRFIRRNRQIGRVYVYQWQTSPEVGWDSGVLRPDGTPRPAFYVLKRALDKGVFAR